MFDLKYHFDCLKHRLTMKSWSQLSEDRIVKWILEQVSDSDKITYLDIGAHHPRINNNTYIFYKSGGVGVSVDPNEDIARLHRKQRPKDTFMNIGVSPYYSGKEEYYIFEKSEFNTCSSIEAENIRHETGMNFDSRVIDVQPINNVLELVYTPNRKIIDFMSIDVEGKDEEILKAMDFSRFRPKVICAEVIGYKQNVFFSQIEIDNHMKNMNYLLVANTRLNHIYVDCNLSIERRNLP